MAPVPWSSTVAGIAKQGLEVDHPLTELLRHEQKMMEVKIVQKKYGLTKFSVANCNVSMKIDSTLSSHHKSNNITLKSIINGGRQIHVDE
jgi:hypothetical protein